MRVCLMTLVCCGQGSIHHTRPSERSKGRIRWCYAPPGLNQMRSGVNSNAIIVLADEYDVAPAGSRVAQRDRSNNPGAQDQAESRFVDVSGSSESRPVLRERRGLDQALNDFSTVELFGSAEVDSSSSTNVKSRSVNSTGIGEPSGRFSRSSTSLRDRW